MQVFSKTALAIALSVGAGSVYGVGDVGASGSGGMTSGNPAMASDAMDRQSTLDRERMKRRGDSLRDGADGQASASHESDRSSGSATASDEGAQGSIANSESRGNAALERDSVAGRASGDGYGGSAAADRDSAQARSSADTEEAEE